MLSPPVFIDINDHLILPSFLWNYCNFSNVALWVCLVFTCWSKSPSLRVRMDKPSQRTWFETTRIDLLFVHFIFCWRFMLKSSFCGLKMAQCLKSFIPKYNVKNVRYKTDIKAHLAIRLSASKKTFAYKLSAVFAILSYIMCFEMASCENE